MKNVDKLKEQIALNEVASFILATLGGILLSVGVSLLIIPQQFSLNIMYMSVFGFFILISAGYFKIMAEIKKAMVSRIEAKELKDYYEKIISRLEGD